MLPKFHVSRLVKAMEKLNLTKSTTNCEMDPVLGTSLHFVRLPEIVEHSLEPTRKYRSILEW